MAYPTKEICQIVPFWFRLYAKVGFSSNSICINNLLTTIGGFLEMPLSRKLNRMVY